MDDTDTKMPDAGGTSQGATPIQEQAQGLAATATEGATGLLNQAKAQLVETATTQKEGLADQIDQLADSVSRSGEQFAGKQDWLAHAIDGGANELKSLATALRENDLGSLLGQVQSFAKRQPGLFIGASLAAGFAIARLGKVVASDLSRDDLPTLPEVGNAR